MKFRLISIPAFKAVHSGVDQAFDFNPEGKLGKFNAYFSEITVKNQDNFSPRDYLYYDKKQQGLVWMYAIFEGLDTKSFPVMDFDGGLYVTYFYNDGDNKRNEELYGEAIKWIKSSDYLELDERENHYAMGHIITPPFIKENLDNAQMESFIPVKIKNKA
ncbi:hypothetical protein [Haploplasma axanthum]|uniref:GyrI-like small molecule binding domain-containing protein n=1 Tax=Haploplasma axanthum TaxID=29552 RepID=A0A449BFR2_HAPAX|nr:hypothetical protein [Haploplasma axanthum]VEU81268.1 Uncharacterised protein [Haploplasma axanthum]